MHVEETGADDETEVNTTTETITPTSSHPKPLARPPRTKPSTPAPTFITVKARTQRKLHMKVRLTALDTGKTVEVMALFDGGCEETSINKDWLERAGFNATPLPAPIIIKNADGTENIEGRCTSTLTARLAIGAHEENISALITKLGSDCPLYLGMDWHKLHNPEINWRTGEIKFSRCQERTCYRAIRKVTIEEECDVDVPTLYQSSEDYPPDYRAIYPDVFTEADHVPLAPH